MGTDTLPALAESLLNAAWLSLAIAGIAALASRSLDRSQTRWRYALWGVAFGSIALLPLSAWIGSAAPTFSPAADFGAPIRQGFPALPESIGVPVGYLAGALLIAGLLRTIQLLFQLRGLRRLKADARPIPLELWRDINPVFRSLSSRGVEMRMSDRVRTPSTVGFLRPAVILPRSLLGQLDAVAWKGIVAHELAHIRRYDDWANLIQRIVERQFFFLPGLYWAGENLELERERSCDEVALQATGDSRSYADALLRIRAAGESSMRLAPAAVSTRPQLSARIELILARAEPAEWRGVRTGLATVMLAAGISGLSLAPRVEFIPPARMVLPAVAVVSDSSFESEGGNGPTRMASTTGTATMDHPSFATGPASPTPRVGFAEPAISLALPCGDCDAGAELQAEIVQRVSRITEGARLANTSPVIPRGADWNDVNPPFALSVRVAGGATAASDLLPSAGRGLPVGRIFPHRINLHLRAPSGWRADPAPWQRPR